MKYIDFWRQLPSWLPYMLSPAKALLQPFAFVGLAAILALIPFPRNQLYPTSPRGATLQACLRLMAIFVVCASLPFPLAFLIGSILREEESIRFPSQEPLSLPDGFQFGFHLRKLLIFPPFVLLWRLAPPFARLAERKALPGFAFATKFLASLCVTFALYYGLQGILTHVLQGQWPERNDGLVYEGYFVRGWFPLYVNDSSIPRPWIDHAEVWLAGAACLWSIGELAVMRSMRPGRQADSPT